MMMFQKKIIDGYKAKKFDTSVVKRRATTKTKSRYKNNLSFLKKKIVSNTLSIF